MNELLLGTNNAGKVMEIKESLSGLDVSCLTPIEKGITETPEEHGSTYQANAEEKAKFYFDRSHLPTLADDSGIIVEALVDELGVHTRRWGAGKESSDAEWIEFFLQRMQQETNRRAHFVCTLAYIDENGTLSNFEGRCNGSITEKLEAEYLPGLPLSACFRPDGSNKVFSALSLEEKRLFSHRGKALSSFREFLELRE